MSLTSALNAAASGLSLINSQLKVTSTNIANANTEGYTTKSLPGTQGVNETSGSSYVMSTQVKRQVDETLRNAYWSELSGGGFAKTLATYTARLDSLFGSLDDSTSLPNRVTEFTDALTQLAADPSSQSVQATVVSAAEGLAFTLNNTSEQVQGMRAEADSMTYDQVQSVNEILKSIEAQETRIIETRAEGQSTAELDDQMDMLLKDLSNYMDVEVHKDSDGALRISTQSGHTLYDDEASQLSFERTAHLTAGVEGGPLSVVSPNGSEMKLSAADMQGGSIGGLLTLRDEVLPEAQTQLDEIAHSMSLALSRNVDGGNAADDGATPPVETGFAADVSGYDQPGDVIELSFTTASGLTRDVSFVAVSDPSMLPLDGSATAGADDLVFGIDISGSGASIEDQISNALGPKFSVSVDAGGELTVLTDTASTGVTMTGLTSYTAKTDVSEPGLAVPVFTDGRDGGKPYTGALENGGQKAGYALAIKVNPEVSDDPSILGGEAGGSGSSAQDSTRAEYLIDQLNTTQFTFSSETGIGASQSPFQGSIADFTRQVISTQGAQADTAQRRLDVTETAVSTAKLAYEQSYKVDVDEQLVNLLELQNAYSANARVLSAVNSMFDELMQVVR
ncbi:flagellar hook-associated protein FlgK [Pseudovibrio sp. SPO723]|uniref:flagellar hook-associated protein FlgK n=1 Tax=Nesiotobacter zosterae TaxID=392721 RepID=UPI0029C39BD7|nr:flagellar hook-associated protein FlgK [Pseudovibrio sp. SPO723]MDX5594139.1 flagellar hook-associated protein FlgK [Pseudovibrio sp. SPO723]